MCNNKTILFAALALAIASSTGCNRISAAADAAKSAASNAASAVNVASDDQWDSKVQTYIEVGNSLNNSHMNATFAEWRARDAKKVAEGDFKAIRTDDQQFDEHTVENLKKAVAMPGKTPELDAAANALLKALETGLPAWRELLEYNKAKRYEDDGGAKGKTLLPGYLTAIQSIDAAEETFAAAVDQAAKQAHDKTLAKYKADGKMLEMHTLEGMGAAEKVVDMFNGEKDFKDAAKIQKANELIAALETHSKGIKDEHAKRKALGDEKSDLPSIDRYDEIAASLVEFAGHYREARSNPERFNDAVNEYNDMVKDYNRM